MQSQYLCDAREAAALDRLMRDIQRAGPVRHNPPGDAPVLVGLAIEGLRATVQSIKPTVAQLRPMMTAIERGNTLTEQQKAKYEAIVRDYCETLTDQRISHLRASTPWMTRAEILAMPDYVEASMRRVCERLLECAWDASPIEIDGKRYCADCGDEASEGERGHWGCSNCGWIVAADPPEEPERFDEFTGPMGGGR